ncbi:hypothetical protein A9Q99_19480 [Gammaproteobacteria bacterium 45_16_T64]|mgnify:CR=1 FL=1|nr:hypothetical protein A9Q99_19480 [Gammaproteobacteria bacterium 45_16_T64]
MSLDKNRLLIELSKTIRDINYDIINPSISTLNVEGLQPVLELVARARAAYIKNMHDLATDVGDGLPNKKQLENLKASRELFEEVLSGAQALEAAVERGYLDVSSRKK